MNLNFYRTRHVYLLQSYLTMIPVLTSFLPPTHTHLYLSAIFNIWEAFNSVLVDERLIEFVGELAEEHVAGNAGPEGGAQWKDVGMWSEKEWTVLISKALGSMSTYLQHGDICDLCCCLDVPVGATRVCKMSTWLTVEAEYFCD